MPTIPASVRSSTTLRRKYGPWQPLAASSGGSGSAIGVTFSPVIVNGGCAGPVATARPRASTAHRQDAPDRHAAASRDDAVHDRSGLSDGECDSMDRRLAHRRRMARSMSRLASCFLSASRLSKVLRPRAMHSSTLAIPFLK